MTNAPMFRQDPNDSEGGYLVSLPGALLMIGSGAYEPNDNEITPAGRAKSKDALARILSAARAGGFTQGDLFDTLLSKGEVSVRVRDLAIAAVAAAGNEALMEIIHSMGIRTDEH